MTSLRILVVFAVIAVSAAQQYYPYNNNNNYYNEPRVTVDRSSGVTPLMEQDAVTLLRQALQDGQRSGNQCVMLRDRFTERYPEHTWHVVKAHAYAIKYIKSIDLLVGNDRYVLFATRR